MVVRAVAGLGVLVALAGCQTAYSEMTGREGVRAEPILDDVYRIRARGNIFTEAATVEDFILLKAAETTVAAGAKYFVIEEEKNRTTVMRERLPGYSFSGSGTRMTIPGASEDLVEPATDVKIRVLRLAPKAPVPKDALDADQIIANVGPRVKRPGG